MRWKGFIFVLLITLVVILTSMLFIDQWIESGLEKTGELLVGARVEIDNLDFHLTDLSIQWDRLQVADPKNTMQNWIETGRVRFDMHLQALLRKRTVIETIMLEDLRTGTPRQQDGALPKRKLKKSQTGKPTIFSKTIKALEKESRQLPIMRFDIEALKRKVHVDSLILLADLKTPQHLDATKTDLNRLSEKWKSFYSGFHPDEDLGKIRDDLRNIDFKNAKNLSDIMVILTKAESARNRLNILSKTIDARYTEAQDDFQMLDGYRKEMKEWIENDYQNLLKIAKLPDLSARGVTKMVLGEALIGKISHYLEYLQLIRKVIPKGPKKVPKEKKPRLKGQNIYFADRHGWPAFLIQNMKITGGIGKSNSPSWIYHGESQGITSQPRVYGRPAVLNLTGQKNNSTAQIWALLDHTSEPAKDSLRISLSDIPLDESSIPDTPYLPSRHIKGKFDVKGMTRIWGDSLDIRIDIVVREILFQELEDSTKDLMTGIIRNIFLNMDRLAIRIDLTGRDELVFRMTSNLDDLVSRELKRQAGDVLLRTEKAIRTRLNSMYGSELAGLNALLVSEQEIQNKPIQDYKNRSDNLRNELQDKLNEIKNEIEKREKEQGDKLENKAEKLLKNLFKKND